ncbi:glutaminyl-peptide cyclotransferase [Oceanidesulfovibrio marinus]|uniref:Glutaminyl-peptide cyclotransferase n=1 Tax=Oceanidesulfovibrio marinus TaxID=370038 RepID=A0ABX6NJW0_9BACT|nr:glutaminyl-peptide cyclotransferase [Oceanidesulfovibrio marinus]QJT10419.1 glutaminyl-peptide cyclotransferase [Oceanidesulfovibrio marinus]
MHSQSGRISRRRFMAMAGGAAFGMASLGMSARAWCAGTVPVRSVRVLSVHDHDPEAFTQGLLLQDGVLFESTGRYGQSDVRRVDWKTGRVLDRRPLPDEYFGEGLALAGKTLYQLTWQEGTAFLYDVATLRPTGQLSYRGEGWGLVWDGRQFYMSDGSADIATRSRDFALQKSVTARGASGPVQELNELELVPGALLANVWQTWQVAYIEPQTGRLLSWLDLTPLREDLAKKGASHGVANGLAWDGAAGQLLVTGKNWPLLYAVRI